MPWIKPSEAARRAGLGKSSIYNLINAPNSPLVTKRLGASIVIDLDSFNRWIDKAPDGTRHALATAGEVEAVDEKIEMVLRLRYGTLAERNAEFCRLSGDVTLIDLYEERLRASAGTGSATEE